MTATVAEVARPGAGSGNDPAERLNESIRRSLGPTCMNALQDEGVEEITLNPDGRIWLYRVGHGWVDTGDRMSPARALSLMNTIASVLDTTVTAENPLLDGNLPLDGSRFSGVIPPAAAGPSFSIRKKALLVYTLEDYVKDGILSLPFYNAILAAVKQRKNILVVGGTASGKTTLLNAIIAAIAKLTPQHRVVIIEDTAEVQCTAQNKVLVQTTRTISMLDLLRSTLRWRPDRIIVGEVRGKEANALLKAWNTGHPGGVASIHANDARSGLLRVEQCVQEGVAVVNPVVIAEAVDVLVVIKKGELSGKRVVEQVAEVVRYDSVTNEYIISDVG